MAAAAAGRASARASRKAVLTALRICLASQFLRGVAGLWVLAAKARMEGSSQEIDGWEEEEEEGRVRERRVDFQIWRVWDSERGG